MTRQIEKTPPMFVEGYDGNDYTVDDLIKGIQWLQDELWTRDKQLEWDEVQEYIPDSRMEPY